MSLEERKCPYCQQTLKTWEPSPYTGWGDTMLYCDNNCCDYFIRGRAKIYAEYDKNFAYRYCVNPKNGKELPIISWCPGNLSLKRARCATADASGMTTTP
jgi:hypothetical protein